jgi:HEPN domain-containing protein
MKTMNKKQKIKYWLEISDYDLETARSMLESKRWLYVVFMCQQAIEKLIKALYINDFDAEPPRTHNLAFLFKKLNVAKGDSDPKAPSDILKLLNVLSAHYLNNRYPDYKMNLSRALSEDKAGKYLKETEEVYKWLKSLLK